MRADELIKAVAGKVEESMPGKVVEAKGSQDAANFKGCVVTDEGVDVPVEVEMRGGRPWVKVDDTWIVRGTSDFTLAVAKAAASVVASVPKYEEERDKKIRKKEENARREALARRIVRDSTRQSVVKDGRNLRFDFNYMWQFAWDEGADPDAVAALFDDLHRAHMLWQKELADANARWADEKVRIQERLKTLEPKREA